MSDKLPGEAMHRTGRGTAGGEDVPLCVGWGWAWVEHCPWGSPRAAGHQTLPKSVLSGLGKETASYLTSVTMSSARRDTVALQGTSPSLRTLEMTLQRLDIPISQV